MAQRKPRTKNAHDYQPPIPASGPADQHIYSERLDRIQPPPVTLDAVRRARRVVASNAVSADDARDLLDALGIGNEIRFNIQEATR